MRKILVTGGTIFVSRCIAEYYTRLIPKHMGDFRPTLPVEQEAEVYVMNRNTHAQVEGVHLIECDKNSIGNDLGDYDFDVVIAVNIYTEKEMKNLIDSLRTVRDFVFISSSAVYPETLPQPFTEEQECGKNSIWGDYGTNKLAAERYLLSRIPQAYVLRPPYLYGRMNNLYRESFAFDCALFERPFYIPNDGSMKLQFFHVNDLCRFIDILLRTHPKQHIFNVGNKESENIVSFVKACYNVAGKEPVIISVGDEHSQRSYFPFHNYSYVLDVTKMSELMPDTMPFKDGLEDSYNWYKVNQDAVNKKPYFDYIDKYILPST